MTVVCAALVTAPLHPTVAATKEHPQTVVALKRSESTALQQVVTAQSHALPVADAQSLLVTIESGQDVQTQQDGEQKIADALNIPATRIETVSTENEKQTIEVQLPGNVSVQQAEELLQEDTQQILPEITTEKNLKRRMATTPNDPLFGTQWHHTGVTSSSNTPTGWGSTTGASTIVIAVVDTGVDTDHPDISGNMWNNTDEVAGNGVDDDSNGYVDDVYGYDFTNNSADPNPNPDNIDEDGDGYRDGGVVHGTHVAGLIAAKGNNGVGVTGIMWNAQIMPVQVLDDEGAGFDSNIAQGIRYAADNGATIINLSLGGAGSTTVLAEAVEYAHTKGATVIAAAGNEAQNLNTVPFYPACYADVIGVASVGQSGAASSFSNFGSDCVDLSAPGELIYSTLYTNDASHGFTNDYGYESGTSMATPIVAGVAGLIIASHPSATATQVKQLLLSSTRNIGLSSSYGIGIVDASKVSQQILLESISAYSNPDKKRKLSENFIYAYRQPYFEWATTGSGIVGYYVYFGTNQNADPRTSGSFTTAKSKLAPTKISGNEKHYYLRVQAKDANGLVSNILTYEYIIDTVVSAPTNIRGKQVPDKKREARITWRKVSNQNVINYQIFRVDPGKKTGKIVGRVKHPSEKFVDKNVQRGKTYTYYVKSQDDLGNTAATAKIKVQLK